MGVAANEFPLLNAAGLYVVHTAGNGKTTQHSLEGCPSAITTHVLTMIPPVR